MTSQDLVGSPVKEFVQAFLSEAEEGMKAQKFVPCTEKEAHVTIELTATEVKEAGGGLKIHVFSIGGKIEGSNAQKMTIYARKIDEEIELAEKQAKLKELDARTKIAEKQTKPINLGIA